MKHLIGVSINLKQLEALVWVVDLGSFRKAAHHLKTTQPNISSRISSLEKTLGVVLMQRDTGGISLTEKGRDILLAARGTLKEAGKIYEIAGREDLVSERLRLGVTELVACTCLDTYLQQIKNIYPSLEIELTVDLSVNLDKELNRNALDLAIQTSPFGSQVDGIVELGKFPYIWVTSAQSPLLVERLHSVADLLPHSVLTHARHTQAYIELSEHLTKSDLPVSRLVTSNSIAACVQMAVAGMGVTLLPRLLVESELKHGILHQVKVDWLPSPLRFAARYHKERAGLHLQKVAAMAETVMSSEN